MNKIFNKDVLLGINKIENDSIDLILTDPPYCLGKDYGNDSDQKSSEDYLNWTYQWIDAVLPKLKKNGSFYIFLSWQYSPEIFVYLKKNYEWLMKLFGIDEYLVWVALQKNFLPFMTI